MFKLQDKLLMLCQSAHCPRSKTSCICAQLNQDTAWPSFPAVIGISTQAPSMSTGVTLTLVTVTLGKGI